MYLLEEDMVRCVQPCMFSNMVIFWYAGSYLDGHFIKGKLIAQLSTGFYLFESRASISSQL